jgi:tetratricopeptide (TPR) repeat protein
MAHILTTTEREIDRAIESGLLQSALQLAAHAAQQQPDHPGISYRYGLVLLRLNRPQEAFAQFSRSLQFDPLAVDTRLAIAQTYLAMKDGWSATAWLSDACRVAPAHAPLWIELAKVLVQQKREAEAEIVLRMGVAANPDSKPMREALAQYSLHGQRYAQGVTLYEDVLALDAQDPKALLHSGICLEHTHELQASAQRYQQALVIQPDLLDAHINLAGLLWRLGDYAGSLAHAQAAVRIDSHNAFAVRMLGTSLLHLNRLDEAQAQLRRALELKPDFSVAVIDLAMLLLLEGKFEEGWPLYARRWQDEERMTRPAFFRPELEWQGPKAQSVAGQRVVIYAEQGLGDVIHFMRYAQLLQQDGATVYGVIQPELVPLIESMPGLTCLKPETLIEADYHVAMLELPLHYRTNLSHLPAATPYLRAPENQQARWKEKLKPWRSTFKVGIAWAGHHIHANHHNRSMPLSVFLPILQMPGVQAFSLQKTAGGAYTDISPSPDVLIDLTTQWNDFADSAAMIEQLDLVISIDSAVIHLAGALNRPAWLVLPPNPDWRWLLERSDSPWYPSLRLYRRAHGQTRSEQIARVAADLRSLVASDHQSGHQPV